MKNIFVRYNSFRIGATKKRARSSRKSFGNLKSLIPSIPNWGALTCGVVIGVAITSVLFFYFSTNDITLKIPAKASRDAVRTKHKTETAATAEQSIANQTPEPRFDFYTELTKNHHEANQQKPAKSAILDLKSAPVPINKYLVQVAAFKHRSDADELKAKLTLNGMDAKIQLAKLDDGAMWHRVVIGPFKNEAAAVAQKDMLRTLDITATLIVKQ